MSHSITSTLQRKILWNFNITLLKCFLLVTEIKLLEILGQIWFQTHTKLIEDGGHFMLQEVLMYLLTYLLTFKSKHTYLVKKIIGLTWKCAPWPLLVLMMQGTYISTTSELLNPGHLNFHLILTVLFNWASTKLSVWRKIGILSETRNIPQSIVTVLCEMYLTLT